MFTYIKLKNFNSFKDITIDLQVKKNEPKNIAIFYGPNGSGKSTIAKAFFTLHKTLETMQVKELLNRILEESSLPTETKKNKDFILNFINKQLYNKSIENIIKENKMINSLDPMSIEYGFSINGNQGVYFIEMDNGSIVHERLEYKISKNRGCYFDIDKNNKYFNEKIFESKEFYEIIKNQIDMYWGKHSFLSILFFEINEKTDEYINSNTSRNFMDVLEKFSSISYKIKQSPNNIENSLNTKNHILQNLSSGEIIKNEEQLLRKVERSINSFFKSIFDDVGKAYYKTNTKNNKIQYQLFLKKNIETYEYEIDFNNESTGTQEILQLLPYFLSAMSGNFVIIDEYGAGIHDVLAANLINSISQCIKGQLLLTTHNTLIMELSNIKAESLYIIKSDKGFQKRIKCITEIEDRIHPNYNYRNRYLTNENYKDGLPKGNLKIDYSELISIFKSIE